MGRPQTGKARFPISDGLAELKEFGIQVKLSAVSPLHELQYQMAEPLETFSSHQDSGTARWTHLEYTWRARASLSEFGAAFDIDRFLPVAGEGLSVTCSHCLLALLDNLLLLGYQSQT